jgi:hypothetical protein
MQNKALAILTAGNHFFGQTRKPWTSLDVNKMTAILREGGYEAEIRDFHTVFHNGGGLAGRTIFYAFSQKEKYRAYLKDIVFFLSRRNRVIPPVELLHCHENKGFQELYKRELGLEDLKTGYYSSLEEVDLKEWPYPFILKTTGGSNGNGVFLIKDPSGLKKIKKRLRKPLGLGKRIDLLRRKYFRRRKFSHYPEYSDRQDYREYKVHRTEEEPFIIQEFIPGLTCDYRVLAACDRYYVTRRGVKKGSFKASGSKDFRFDKTPDQALLDFARKVYERFHTPFLSLDILFDGKNHYLTEFQALHFGVSVIKRSAGYFHRLPDGRWAFREEEPDLEAVFARTFLEFLRSNP